VFVQVVSARVADGTALVEHLCRLRPGDDAFLGLTAGVSADRRFVSVARFSRPPGTAWWAPLERWLDGSVEVRESSDVELLLGGGSDRAGYVEIIEGRTTDRMRFMHLERQLEQRFAAERPDFLGSMLVWWADGTWLEMAYFTSEADVRAGDASVLPPDVRQLVAAWEDVARPSSQLELINPCLSSAEEPTLWVVAGCLFEISLPGGAWRWTNEGPEVTLLGHGVRGGREHLRFRAEAPGAKAGAVKLRFERDGAGAPSRSVAVRIAPEEAL
jgi:hypothetical protein